MSYIPNELRVTDNSPIAHFARVRMANPEVFFDLKQITTDAGTHSSNLMINSTELSGSGTSAAYSSALSRTRLSVSAGTNGKRSLRTAQAFSYKSGQALIAIFTFNFVSSTANVIKRVGLFDDTDGAWLQENGSQYRLAVLNNVNETNAVQSNWNLDPMDGTGPSGITIDWTKIQMFFIDMEWNSRIRYGFIINGKPIYAHEINHTNSGTGVMMRNPNLPARFTIENTASAATTLFDVFGCTIIGEGRRANSGIVRTFDRGTTPINLTGTSIYPIIAIRANADFPQGDIHPVSCSLYSPDNVDYRWLLIANPTINSPTGSWTSPPFSSMEVNNSWTETTTLTISATTSIVLESGYATSSATSKSSFYKRFDLGERMQFWPGFDEATPTNYIELVLAVEPFVAGSEDFYGTLTLFEEI